MENPQQPSADAGKPASGVARDFDRLKVHGLASAAEVREFVAQMRGRSPQEVLGLVAASRLVRSLVLATLGAIAVLVVFSVGPYLLSDRAKPATVQQPSPAAPAEEEPAAEGPTPQAAAAAAAETVPPPDRRETKKAIELMGIGETKTADPKKNPLEDKLDNLLDKLE